MGEAFDRLGATVMMTNGVLVMVFFVAGILAVVYTSYKSLIDEYLKSIRQRTDKGPVPGNQLAVIVGGIAAILLAIALATAFANAVLAAGQ